MARRFKNEPTKRQHEPKNRKKSGIKISKKKVFIFIVIIAIIVGIYFLVTNNNNNLEVNSELNVSRYKDITSDFLRAKDLNNEVIQNVDIEEMQVIKIQYKLESLEKGKVILLYKIKDNKMLEVTTNMETKKIEEAKVVESPDDADREEIGVNLDEDIKEDYEDNTKRLDPDEGKNILNIILTNTEIIISPSAE